MNVKGKAVSRTLKHLTQDELKKVLESEESKDLLIVDCRPLQADCTKELTRKKAEIVSFLETVKYKRILILDRPNAIGIGVEGYD